LVTGDHRPFLQVNAVMGDKNVRRTNAEFCQTLGDFLHVPLLSPFYGLFALRATVTVLA
jgi:hypothetical protein